jgi:hypothetical protein
LPDGDAGLALIEIRLKIHGRSAVSPTAAKLVWISLLPIGWLLSRYTARWLPTTDAA